MKTSFKAKLKRILFWAVILFAYATASLVFYPAGAWLGKFFGFYRLSRYCGLRSPQRFFPDVDLEEMENMARWQQGLTVEDLGRVKLYYDTGSVSPDTVAAFKLQLNDTLRFLNEQYHRPAPRFHLQIVPPLEEKLGSFDLWQVKISRDRILDHGLLSHELTHVYNFDSIINIGYPASYPPWYDEGLAEYMAGRYATTVEYRDYHLRHMPYMPGRNRINQITLQPHDYLPGFTRVTLLCDWLGDDAHIRLTSRFARGEILHEAFFNAFGFPFRLFEERWREKFRAANVLSPVTPEGLVGLIEDSLARRNIEHAVYYITWSKAKKIPAATRISLWARCRELGGDLHREQGDNRKALSSYRLALKRLNRISRGNDVGSEVDVVSEIDAGNEIDAAVRDLRERLERKIAETQPEVTKKRVTSLKKPDKPGTTKKDSRHVSLLGFLWMAPVMLGLVLADRKFSRSVTSGSTRMKDWAQRNPVLLGGIAALTLNQINRICWGIGLEYWQGFMTARDYISGGTATALCFWTNHLLLLAVAAILFKPFALPRLAIKDFFKGFRTATGVVFLAAAGMIMSGAAMINPALGLWCPSPGRAVLSGIHGLVYSLFTAYVLAAVFFSTVNSHTRKTRSGFTSTIITAALFSLYLSGRHLDPIAFLGLLLLGAFVCSFDDDRVRVSFGAGFTTALLFLGDSLLAGWHYAVGKVGLLVPAGGQSGILTGGSTGIITGRSAGFSGSIIFLGVLVLVVVSLNFIKHTGSGNRVSGAG